MKKIVLLRHGESAWNKENRFTGWTDVDLTEKGVAEAEKAGETLKEYGFNFDKAYTSYLKRAVKTLNCVLDKMNLDWIPVEKNWRLNDNGNQNAGFSNHSPKADWELYHSYDATQALVLLHISRQSRLYSIPAIHHNAFHSGASFSLQVSSPDSSYREHSSRFSPHASRAGQM